MEPIHNRRRQHARSPTQGFKVKMVGRQQDRTRRSSIGLILTAICVLGQSQTSRDIGLTALQRGDYAGAERYYREELKQSPKSPEVLSDLGIALQMQGKSTEAIQTFEMALRIKYLPRTYALLAEERCETRDQDSARPMLTSIMRKYSTDPSILALIAPCVSEIGEPLESIKVYETLLSHHVAPTDLVLIQLAKSHLKAAQFFLSRLSRSPESTPYLNAIRSAQENASPNARGAFDIAVHSSPYFRSDLDFSTAVSRLNAHPDDLALLYLVSVLSGERSIRLIDLCEQTHPDSPYLEQLKAEMLANQGHNADAINLYQHLAAEHPELPHPLYDLGMLFRQERRWDLALDAFQKQLARYPNNEQSAARVSEALFQLSQWKKLTEFLSPRVAIGEPPLWAMLDYAEAMQNLEDPDGAIKMLLKAEQFHPTDRVVHYRLALLYRTSGNSMQAKKELQAFRDLDGK